jgi:hypothetical protein
MWSPWRPNRGMAFGSRAPAGLGLSRPLQACQHSREGVLARRWGSFNGTTEPRCGE